MNSEYKLNLIESYVSRLMEDMDMKTICAIAETTLRQDFLTYYTYEQLATEVRGAYPDLLEEDKD